MAHPIPCCVRCPICDVAIPNGVRHVDCAGATAAPHRLVHGLARYDTAFAGFMALLAIALAVYAAGSAGFLLLGAAAAGLVVAILKLRRR